ncbi:TrbI/VirB10 family protein [Azohydromonas australica]|uniref:TrbI/VirB10 family protein n=1 Tax=Azohydromonas australica TaxID=364039 RepID=UPI00042229CD|nr:TrbI/VirB10 family protein [Azohydromonas australica]
MSTISTPQCGTAAAPAPQGIPSVAGLAKKRSQRRRWITMGVVGAAVASIGGGAVWYLHDAVTGKFKVVKEERGPSPVGATEGVAPAFVSPPRKASAPDQAASAASEPTKHKVPPPEPRDDEISPIPIKGGGGSPSPKPRRDPRDGPMMVISKGNVVDTRLLAAVQMSGADLDQRRQELQQRREHYQRQIDTLMARTQAMVDQRAAQATQAAPGASAPLPGAAASAPARSNPMATATVVADQLTDSTLTLPFGSVMQCTSLTKVATTVGGPFSCLVARNVYGADHKIVLIEAGSILEAEYDAQSVRLGVNAIPINKLRLRTPAPNSILIDLPASVTGPLGEGGLQGHINNRWAERLGPAIFLSLMSDTAKLLIARESDGATGNTVVIGSGTLQQGDRLATDVARRTLDIPPVFTVNQGATVYLHIKQNVDFSKVYALRASR